MEWVVPQWLGWFSHSLAYDFTKLEKTSHTTFHGHSTCLLWWLTPCEVCFSESKQIHLLPITVSLTEFFCNETSRARAFIRPKTRHHRFCPASCPSGIQRSDKPQHRVPAMWVWVPILGKRFQAQLLEMERSWPAQYFVSSGIDGERSWRMGGKSSGKNVTRNPLHNLLENLLNTWPVLTVFIGLILGTRRLRTEELPPAWATATRALQIVEPSGHPGTPTATHLFAQCLRKQEMRL